jgi:sarcosine oxidase
LSETKTYDIAVIGAGVFGAWTAWHLAKRGKKVVLIDAYGAANARASSGGESRIIRMGYGADELYTLWSQRSLEQWKKIFAALKQLLFHETGVLWLGGDDDAQLRRTAITLKRCKMPFEEMDRAALEKRYSQISFEDTKRGILEPHCGVLLARRAVAALLLDALGLGVLFCSALVIKPAGWGRV